MLPIRIPAFLLAFACLFLLGQAGAEEVKPAPFNLTIKPSPPVQCEPTVLDWSSSGNMDVTIYSKLEDQDKEPEQYKELQRYIGITGDNFTWATNVTAGTQVVIVVVALSSNDTGGSIVTSSMTIQSGSDSCLDGHTNGVVASPTGKGAVATAGFGIIFCLLAVIAM